MTTVFATARTILLSVVSCAMLTTQPAAGQATAGDQVVFTVAGEEEAPHALDWGSVAMVVFSGSGQHRIAEIFAVHDGLLQRTGKSQNASTLALFDSLLANASKRWVEASPSSLPTLVAARVFVDPARAARITRADGMGSNGQHYAVNFGNELTLRVTDVSQQRKVMMVLKASRVGTVVHPEKE